MKYLVLSADNLLELAKKVTQLLENKTPSGRTWKCQGGISVTKVGETIKKSYSGPNYDDRETVEDVFVYYQAMVSE